MADPEDYQQEMSPVAQVVNLICSNIEQFEPLGLKEDYVYPYMIDRDDDSDEDPIVVVSELPRSGHEYGNDTPIYERRRVQLTFYYPRDYEGPEEGLEQCIRSFLLSKNIYCYQNAGHVLTPDSQNITNTLKFNIKKEII